MKVELIAVGKIKPPFTEAEGHYLKMLKPLMPVAVTEVKDDEALGRKVTVATVPIRERWWRWRPGAGT